MDKTTVEYRDVEGFECYRVGSDGSVWSCRTGRWFRLAVRVQRRRKGDGKGYLHVDLRKKRGAGKVFRRYVHRLVLTAFVGPCPAGMVTCHNDGDRHNNRLENLRWDTLANNQEDRKKHGTARLGEESVCAKLTTAAVIAIRIAAASGEAYPSIAERHGISRAYISEIVLRRKWRHVP